MIFLLSLEMAIMEQLSEDELIAANQYLMKNIFPKLELQVWQ